MAADTLRHQPTTAPSLVDPHQRHQDRAARLQRASFRRALRQPRELRGDAWLPRRAWSFGIGGAHGKHGRYEYTQTHVAYIQDEPMHQEPRREDTEIVA
jgi:hypothetical protein